MNKYHSEQLQYVDRYIERLEREVKGLKRKNERLHSIIKEAREYCDFGIKEWITDDGFVEEVLKDVKEILDKVEKVGEE